MDETAYYDGATEKSRRFRLSSLVNRCRRKWSDSIPYGSVIEISSTKYTKKVKMLVRNGPTLHRNSVGQMRWQINKSKPEGENKILLSFNH